MEFQYDFKRKSKHKISNIEKLLKKDCILKMKISLVTDVRI